MTALWTCPFCPLLCDRFSVAASPVEASPAVSPGASAGACLVLQGSDCTRARDALARFGPGGTALPQVGARQVTLDVAVATAAEWLARSRQPLFGGLGTDVAGARALYRLACETGAITDAAHGRALMHGLRALQDRGAFTTTLAEVRERADVVVCLTGSPAERLPEFYRRCGIGEAMDGEPSARHLVMFDGAAADAERALPQSLPGVTTEALAWHGDLFTTVSVLAALVARRTVRDALPALAALAARLRAARYAVLVWEAAALPAHGALVAEGINTIVGTLNRSTRSAALPLGGSDGAATVNQVFTWLGGLPLRSRLGPAGLEHEPHRFDAARLLADGAVDALLWVASFGTEPAVPQAAVPRIVLGHPRFAPALAGAQTVFIPAATPGVGSAGHLFRADGVVLMPLTAVVDQQLPTVADVLARLTLAVQALRPARAVA
ncbi:MAG: formylmethanofuran dehydrogenase [Methylibium sp. NZG]|nr:MAG: formylmethanofuran dehydrogenase [Methylibium sp. NZG]